MYLKCRSCRGVVRPDQAMVLVVTVKPAQWRRTLEAQLGIAPGVWHWACAPQAVRQYAPIVLSEPANEPEPVAVVIEKAGEV